MGERVLDEEGEAPATLGGGIIARDGEKPVAGWCQVGDLGFVTCVLQPGFGQQHHVDVVVSDEIGNFGPFFLAGPTDRALKRQRRVG